MNIFPGVAEKELPKNLRYEPFDNIKLDKVAGAMYALEWFLSGENNRLATYLAFTVQDNPEADAAYRSNQLQ